MRNILYSSLLLLIIIFAGCEEDIVEKLDYPDYTINEYLYELMVNEKWYYWIDDIEPVKPNANENSSNYIKRLRYNKYDTWSYVQDIESHDAYYSSGEYVGYGFLALKHIDSTLRFALVFEDSPMGDMGIKRGYKLLKIDDFDAFDLFNSDNYADYLGDKNSHSFTVEDHAGNQFSFNRKKKTINQSTILSLKLFTINEKKIGYMMFNSFTGPAFDDLEAAFSIFKSEQIDELIVDLRYNGGGQVSVAIYLGNLLAGWKADGEIFNKTRFNQYKSENDEIDYFELDQNSIELDRVFFITTSGSASASELVINGVLPFLDVKIIGKPSHGKPVGMRTFRYKDMVAAPVTFKGVNANNEGEYFNGFPVDAPINDGLDKEFGDENEACLKQALYYIANGEFIDTPQLKSTSLKEKPYPLEGFQRVVGAH